MKHVLTGRADLARAYLSGGSELQKAVAGLLGFESLTPQVYRLEAASGRYEVRGEASVIAHGEPGSAEPSINLPFWQANSFRVFESSVARLREELVAGDDRDGVFLERRVLRPVEYARLASRVEALSRIRRTTELAGSGTELDLDQVVERLSRAELISRLPHRSVKRWGQEIQVIVDRSRRLIPYWQDQELMLADLKRVYRAVSFQVAILADGAEQPSLLLPAGEPGLYRMPEPGANVIVLGDLGCLDQSSADLWRWWLHWGLRLRANENHTLAVVPCHVDRCPAKLSDAWKIIPWENPGRATETGLGPERTAAICRKILTLLSFSLRLEPRMIRAVRRVLPECRWDPGIESIVWQDDALVGRCHDGAAFDPARVQALRDEVNHIDPEERRKAYELVETLRRDTYPGIWYAELLGLEHEVSAGVVKRTDFDAALTWFAQWRHKLTSSPEHSDLAGDYPTWFRRACARLPRVAYQGAAARTLHAIWLRVHSRESSQRLPDFLHPGLMPVSTQPVRAVVVSQVANRIVARPIEAETYSGSPIGLIRTRNGQIKIEPDGAFWEGGIRPEWAADWGRDQYGAWATFQVGGVIQQLRWIPPGKFLMG
ncbi:MAG TPA: hypothetical protein VJY33_21890, partial [Isosphaeraceae bacterium]|nr:hypothetical protein [Isosphaeraceae bacterium]